jgi:Family of unknown function (DUF6119)
MRLLLTSAGIKNASIHDALVELLNKPIAESDALCIPTALYGHPMAGPRQAWRFISGQEPRSPMVGLGWKSLGVLELTALPSLGEERWVPRSERRTSHNIVGCPCPAPELFAKVGDSIELCDLLTRNRRLIHVKKRGTSSTLSHLFSRGVVSAELLARESPFRTSARERAAALDRPSRNGPEASSISCHCAFSCGP